MTKDNFLKVVKAFSLWRIDKRKGNYRLPSKSKLSEYLYELIRKIMTNNKLAFRKNGHLGDIIDGKIFVPYCDDEQLDEMEQRKRTRNFICEILGLI